LFGPNQSGLHRYDYAKQQNHQAYTEQLSAHQITPNIEQRYSPFSAFKQKRNLKLAFAGQSSTPTSVGEGYLS